MPLSNTTHLPNWPHLLIGFAVLAACSFDSTGRNKGLTTCGNKFLDEGEECDGNLFGGKRCYDFGFTDGPLACTRTCQIDTSNCHTCGNGIREGREDCDGNDPTDETCHSVASYVSGTLRCTHQCRWDISQCFTCGNGRLEADELCDGFVPSYHTCMSATGHESGKLTCTKSCELDTSQCHTCGNDIAEGPEACDGTNLKGKDCASLGYVPGTLSCTNDCQLDASNCLNPPEDWLDNAWLYRRPIVVDKEQVDGNLTGFPLLVSFVEPDLGKHAPTANQLVFTAVDGKTVLPKEIVSYDPTLGSLVAWVYVPFLNATIDTKLYVYYGNDSSPAPPEQGSVWSDGFVAVWHLDDKATDESTGALHQDAVTGEHYGIQHGNHDVEGKVGRAQSFDGTNDFIEIVNPDGIQLGDTDCSVSAWIRTKSTQSIGLLTKTEGTHHVPGNKLIGLRFNKFAVDHGWVGYLETTKPVNDEEWRHVVWSQRRNAQDEEERWRLYIDGVLDAQERYTTVPDEPGHALRIGGGTSGSFFPNSWAGEIDEVWVSNVVRSPTWVSAIYANQYAPQSFAILGNEETILVGP